MKEEAPPPPSSTPKRGSVEHEQRDAFPDRAFKGNSLNASGLALTVTGDGSGALLVIQVGNSKDYVVPIDFTGRKDIFIPTSETSRTAGVWGMRYATKRATYGIFHGVFIGFGRVPANTHAKILIENLRMVGEKPTLIKNPVIHAGDGTLAIQGEVKSSQYLVQLVKAAFNQRRKTLRNAVRDLFDPTVLADELFNKRAEQLSVEDFAALTFRMK